METFLLNLFSFVLFFSSLMVVCSQNPVHSLLFLVMSFCNASGLLLLYEIEFIALLLIIVYVGAIAVLFLFVMMMLNAKKSQSDWTFLMGPFLFLQFWLQILILFEKKTIHPFGFFESFYKVEWFQKVNVFVNVELLGGVLYTYYSFFFLVCGVILLLAMIGVIVLTTDFNSQVKRQQIFQQVARDFKRAIFLTQLKKQW